MMRHRAILLRLTASGLTSMPCKLHWMIWSLVFAWAGVIGRPIGWLRRGRQVPKEVIGKTRPSLILICRHFQLGMSLATPNFSIQMHDGHDTFGACARFRVACPDALLHDHALLVNLLFKFGTRHRKSGRCYDGPAWRVETWN